MRGDNHSDISEIQDYRSGGEAEQQSQNPADKVTGQKLVIDPFGGLLDLIQ